MLPVWAGRSLSADILSVYVVLPLAPERNRLSADLLTRANLGPLTRLAATNSAQDRPAFPLLALRELELTDGVRPILTFARRIAACRLQMTDPQDWKS